MAAICRWQAPAAVRAREAADIKIGAPLYPFIEPGYRQINADQKEKLDAAIEALKSGGFSVLGEEWPSDAVSSHTVLTEAWTALV
eukprot:COSAG04_NODE_758_length_10539_cov_5.024521_2_plen_85_part_00